MRLSKSRLREIVKEELIRFIVLEARDGEDEKEPDVVAGDEENSDAPPQQEPDDVAPKRGAEAEPPPPEGEEVPTGDDQSDDDLSQDVEEPGAEEPEEGSDISDTVSGKTLQSITASPESKLMPGAREVVLTFDEVPEPLRILIGKSGMVKYFYKGLHNEL